MDTLAVLVSGGLDSAILLADELKRNRAVYPLYITFGLAWEDIEFNYLHRYLHALHCPALQPLTVLDVPVTDLYGYHWSITGTGVPEADSPDEAVFLPGRNVLLLSKSLVWCHLHHVPRIALGALATNPFPDATRPFFQSMQSSVDLAMQGQVTIHLPFSGMKKVAVMHLGRDLPLQHTFSCISPDQEIHCGKCNKCAERRRAFVEAGMADPTAYAGG